LDSSYEKNLLVKTNFELGIVQLSLSQAWALTIKSQGVLTFFLTTKTFSAARNMKGKQNRQLKFPSPSRDLGRDMTILKSEKPVQRMGPKSRFNPVK